MRSCHRPWLVLALLALTGCTSAADRTELALIGGEAFDEPSVVALEVEDLFGPGVIGQCTGTLVGAYGVVTAKHCVIDSAGVIAPPGKVHVLVTGSYLSGSSAGALAVREVRATPGASYDHEGGDVFGADVAILLLEDDASSDATPQTVDFDAPSRLVAGASLGISGFGAPIGARRNERRGAASVREVLSFPRFSTIWIDEPSARLCSGDSGGPVTSGGSMIAVASSVIPPDPDTEGVGPCGEGASGFAVRVDRHESLIRQAVGFRPGCAARETCGNGTDDDCNALVDDACGVFGASCARGATCASGMCAAGACSQRCGDTPCPSGYRCTAGLCVPPPPSSCGDRVVDSGEVCDEGTANGAYGGECSVDCRGQGPRCGDGSVDSPFETCDDGALNGTLGRCTIYCAQSTSCGDGITNGAAPCIDDPSAVNLCYRDCDYDLDCSRACYVQLCTPELCDDADANGDYDRCDVRCTGEGRRCGDRVLEADREACDDGNVTNGDGCSAECELEDEGLVGDDDDSGDDDDDSGDDDDDGGDDNDDDDSTADGGCSATPGAASPFSPLILVALTIAARRRRGASRRR